MKKLIYLFVMAMLVSGCATNPYSKFYHDTMNGVDPFKVGVIMPTTNPEIIMGGEDPKADGKKMAEDNYGLLGYSSFWATRASNEQAIKFGKEIHAEKIILYTKYKDTRSGVVPITLPNNQITTTRGMIGSQFVSAQTTTYGTQTNYVPYSVDRYDYLASYWLKQPPPILGLVCNDLSDELRKQISSNKGVVVFVVIKGSPAFNADFFEGDIIKKIDDTEIVDKMMLQDLIHNKFTGKKITITFLRDGKELNKTVQTNSKPNVP